MTAISGDARTHVHTRTQQQQQTLGGAHNAKHAHQEATRSHDTPLKDIAKSLPSSLSSPNSYACVVGGTSQPAFTGGICVSCRVGLVESACARVRVCVHM